MLAPMRFLILTAVALTALAPRAAAQLSDREREVGLNMLGGVFWVLDSLYFDSSYGESDWAEHWWPAREQVRQAANWGEVLGAIANAVYGMGDSHTRFVPPGLTLAVDYGWRWRVIGDACYVAEVRRGSDAAKQGLRVGDRVLTIDGMQPTRRNLDVITYVYHELNPRDRMQVVVERPDGRVETVAFAATVRRRPPVSDLADIETRRRLLYEEARDSELRHRWKEVDSVAVWGFNAFGLEDRHVDSHLRNARQRSWLILDLRRNGGGVLETAAWLLGHFTDTTYTAYTQVWHDSTATRTVAPRGPGPYAGRVIVLVDSESASSAEIVAWTLRERHGATLVGDRTAGKVRGSWVIPLHAPGGSGRFYPFGVQVSVFDIVMPDGTKLEGTGLEPDVVVLTEGTDLAAGRDPVLQRALALAGVTLSVEEAGKLWR